MNKKQNKISLTPIITAQLKAKKVLPIILGERARRFFELSFKKEGFTNESFNPWKKRKRETKRSTGKKILSDKGILSNSIRRRHTSFNRTIISSKGIRYANYHNKGTKITPKRQFIGNSKKLEKGLQKLAEYELKKLIK